MTSTDIEISFSKDINQEQLLNLYNDVGWQAYTKDPKKLFSSIKNSLLVVSLWYRGQLIALIRTVGDGETIVYIQDILVLTKYQRQGLGEQLIDIILEKFKSVRQFVLLTDNNPATLSFYKKVGFKNVNDVKLSSFVKLSNL